MGVKLSSSGGLTFSQKQGLTLAQQGELLKKLSKLDINKPILKKVEEQAQIRKENAEKRRKENEKKLEESAEAQKDSSKDTKSSKKSPSK
jgi:DNA-binding transcriptional MerR regulator